MTLMRIAPLGQAWTQAGASPEERRSLHMSHLRTMPRDALYFGASYGHMNRQYWQPMHWSSRCLTMPVTGSFSYALTGQPSMHAGSRQWWHAVVTVLSAGASAVPPWSSPTVRHTSPSSRSLSEWQPVAH